MDLQIPRKFTFATAQISGPRKNALENCSTRASLNFNIQHSSRTLGSLGTCFNKAFTCRQSAGQQRTPQQEQEQGPRTGLKSCCCCRWSYNFTLAQWLQQWLKALHTVSSKIIRTLAVWNIGSSTENNTIQISKKKKSFWKWKITRE